MNSDKPPKSSLGGSVRRQLKADAESNKAVGEFKVPDSNLLVKRPKRKKVKVLDEEDYADKVSAIIQRDFFPELEKLKDQSDYIDAADKNDVSTIQRLQERYSSARIHARLNTPGSTFETPETDPTGGASKEDYDPAQPTPDQTPGGTSTAATSSSGVDPTKPTESLDKFMAKHTSEDNESFSDLMDEEYKAFRHAKAWMFKKEEQLSIEMKAKQLALPSPEEQAQIACQTKMTKGTPEGWTYKNVNQVFYFPEGVELSKEEKIELAKKEREIKHENTRFTANPWKSKVQSEDVLKTMVAKQEASLGKVGVDGKDVVERTGTPSINGYKLMKVADATPQIAPGESPMMTWGEVESTPYRLEGAETPLINPGPSKEGAPSFTMQAVPKRDRLALELAEKNSKFHRDKKGKAIRLVRTIKTPKTGSMTDKLSAMSPAAQRLASSKLGIRVGTDKALSAAYSPSPRRTPRSSRTPGSSRTPSLPTPVSASGSRRAAISAGVRKMGSAATPKTPTVSTGPKTPARLDDSLTDDLLNLPSKSSSGATPTSSSGSSKSRSKASDFFWPLSDDITSSRHGGKQWSPLPTPVSATCEKRRNCEENFKW